MQGRNVIRIKKNISSANISEFKNLEISVINKSYNYREIRKTVFERMLGTSYVRG